LAQNKSPEDILEMLLSEKDMKIIGKSLQIPVQLLKRANGEKYNDFGKEEIMGMINENHGRRRIAFLQ